MNSRTKRIGSQALIVGVLGAAVYLGGWSVLEKAAIPIAVALVFGLARRYLPARNIADKLGSHSVSDLNQRFRGTQWAVGFAMVVVGVAFFWLTHLAFVEANRALAASEGAARFVLLP